MNYSTTEEYRDKLLKEKAREVSKLIEEEKQIVATASAKVKLALVFTTAVTDLLDVSKDSISDDEATKVIAKINETFGKINAAMLNLQEELTKAGVIIPVRAIDINDILVQTKEKSAILEYEAD